jgi:hypothetical protein
VNVFVGGSVLVLVLVRSGLPSRFCACKRIDLEVFRAHGSTPAPVWILEVEPTDQRRVLSWLVRCKVGNQPAIAERGGIAVEHEHATPIARERQHLAGATVGIEVAGEQRGRWEALARAAGI